MGRMRWWRHRQGGGRSQGGNGRPGWRRWGVEAEVRGGRVAAAGRGGGTGRSVHEPEQRHRCRAGARSGSGRLERKRVEEHENFG